MQFDEEIVCVECGNVFYLDDADDVSYTTSSVRCPECGRYNFCDTVDMEGFEIEPFDPDDSLVDTDEIYTEDYLSDDLEYDGENKYSKSKQKRIGVAKRKNSMPVMPVFEYRKAVAKSIPEAHSGFRTKTEGELLLYGDAEDTEIEQ